MINNKTKSLIHTFKIEDSDYTYVSNSNSVYSTSTEAYNFIKSKVGDDLLLKELDEIVTVEKSNNIEYRVNIFLKDEIINTDSVIEYFKNELRNDRCYVFLEVLYFKKNLDSIYKLNDFFKSNRCKLILVLDLKLHQDFSNVLKEAKISTKYFSNVNFLNICVERNPKISGLIELRINTLEELKLFDKISLPNNLKLAFSSKNDKVTNELFKIFDDSLSFPLKPNKKNSRLIDLINLLNINLGSRMIEKRVSFFSSKDSLSQSDIGNRPCNTCWAKNNCWRSGIYNVFGKHPYLVSENIDNCNKIKYLNEKIIKLFTKMNLDSTIRKKFEISFGSKKILLKKINP